MVLENLYLIGTLTQVFLIQVYPGLEPILADFQSKEPISIPNWSNFPLWGNLSEAKNCSTGTSSSSFLSCGGNGTRTKYSRILINLKPDSNHYSPKLEVFGTYSSSISSSFPLFSKLNITGDWHSANHTTARVC